MNEEEVLKWWASVRIVWGEGWFGFNYLSLLLNKSRGIVRGSFAGKFGANLLFTERLQYLIT